MFKTYRTILQLFETTERRKFYLLVVMIGCMGVLEAVSTASILPFLAILADPGIIERNPYLSSAYDISGAATVMQFHMIVGTAVFAIIMFGQIFKALTSYWLIAFTLRQSHMLATTFLAGYLYQPYSWFLNQNTSDLGKTVLSEIQNAIGTCIMPAMRLIANSMLTLFLVGVLLFAEPVIALGAALILGLCYASIYLYFRNFLVRNGDRRLDANKDRFKAAQEAFSGIKDVKLGHLEQSFISRFETPSRNFANAQSWHLVVSEMPRYLLEALTFGGMILVVLTLLATRSGQLVDLIPTLGLMVFAGARLFPVMQQVYHNVAAIRFSSPALEALRKDLAMIRQNAAPPSDPASSTAALAIEQSLELRNVCYRYPSTEQQILDDLTLTIAAKSTVGFVGATGSGKTTTIDIILGLLAPESGAVLVDDQVVTGDRLRAWQRNIGYVPQQIFLTDDTIAANIAFGVALADIDLDAVASAARVAELHDFILDQPEGYDTVVGERGVRLSGGQRQRIGIARALYHNPEVLVMDEATSALDNVTERAVMAAVHNLAGEKTIIMIAHRISTIRNCDTIFLLDKGRVADSGAYSDLVDRNPTFRQMAGDATTSAAGA